MTSDPIALLAIGAGLVLMVVLLVVASVALIVHWHEVREIRLDSERHAEIRRDLDDLRRLTLNAIGGRAAMEQDVASLKMQVQDLDDRLQAVEAGQLGRVG